MYFKSLSFLFLPFVIFYLSAASADEPKQHGQKTPHGGMLQEAEGIHIEFLMDKNGEPKLFLYDKAMKPLERSDVQAKLTVKGHDGNQHTRELKFAKDPKAGGLFKGEAIKGLSDWDTAVVSIMVKDGWSHVRFSHHH